MACRRECDTRRCDDSNTATPHIMHHWHVHLSLPKQWPALLKTCSCVLMICLTMVVFSFLKTGRTASSHCDGIQIRQPLLSVMSTHVHLKGSGIHLWLVSKRFVRIYEKRFVCTRVRACDCLCVVCVFGKVQSPLKLRVNC